MYARFLSHQYFLHSVRKAILLAKLILYITWLREYCILFWYRCTLSIFRLKFLSLRFLILFYIHNCRRGPQSSESPTSQSEPVPSSALTGNEDGHPDHAHSQDITDTQHARDQHDPIGGRPDRDSQLDENIGQSLTLIKESITAVWLPLYIQSWTKPLRPLFQQASKSLSF